MQTHLVTGYKGSEHIKSADQGSFNAAFFGSGQFVMEMGNQFEGSIVNNNTVRILDGDILMYGRHIRIDPDTFEDLTIETGNAGKNRIDLVCMTYEKNTSDGTEKAYLEVLKGSETEGTPSAPEYTDGNIITGAIKNQMPLYKLNINGVVLQDITPLFKTIPTYKTLAEQYAAQFQKACDTYLGALNILDTMEEVNANTQANQLAGALAVKEVIKNKQDAATAITTSNIGSQSVKHATSAGSATSAGYANSAGSANAVAWGKVTGKPSSYPPSSHSHDYLPNNPPCIEIFGQGGAPFIDFHYGGSSADYTSRLIDASSTFNYLTNSGIHQFCNGNGSQVARVQSNGTFGALSGGTAIVGSAIYCQSNWSGSSYTPVYGASFTNPSSRLVKENVTDMSEEEAKKVLLLNPIEFNYIKEFGGEKNQRGLIAEDALDIIPSCVTVPDGYSEEDFDASKGIQNKVLAIDYSKLVPYLIKMVQIQQEEIEKLKEAINKEGVSND